MINYSLWEENIRKYSGSDPMKDSTAGESKKLESISIRLSSGIDGSV